MIVKQVGLDSIVAVDIELDEGTKISKCIIGKGVKIGKKSKLVNCVILDNVEIGNE